MILPHLAYVRAVDAFTVDQRQAVKAATAEARAGRHQAAEAALHLQLTGLAYYAGAMAVHAAVEGGAWVAAASTGEPARWRPAAQAAIREATATALRPGVPTRVTEINTGGAA